jgi:hypothetical protein
MNEGTLWGLVSHIDFIFDAQLLQLYIIQEA